MAYGDLSLDAPSKPNKGHEDGACNRRSCQAEPANWYNHGSHSWYCLDCAKQIGEDVVNARCWPADFARMFPDRPLHPMFETREMMDTRQFGVTFDAPVTSGQIIDKLQTTLWPRQSGKTLAMHLAGVKPVYDVDTSDNLPAESRQVRRARERKFFKEFYRNAR